VRHAIEGFTPGLLRYGAAVTKLIWRPILTGKEVPFEVNTDLIRFLTPEHNMYSNTGCPEARERGWLGPTGLLSCYFRCWFISKLNWLPYRGGFTSMQSKILCCCSQARSSVLLGVSAALGDEQQRAAERATVYLRKLQEIEDLEEALRRKWLTHPLEGDGGQRGGHERSSSPEERLGGAGGGAGRGEAGGRGAETEGGASRQVEAKTEGRDGDMREASGGQPGRERDAQHWSQERAATSGREGASRAAGGLARATTEGVPVDPPSRAVMEELLELSAEQLLEFCNTCVDQIVDSEFLTPPATPRTTLGLPSSSMLAGCTAR
jgi:hypothetical protein